MGPQDPRVSTSSRQFRHYRDESSSSSPTSETNSPASAGAPEYRPDASTSPLPRWLQRTKQHVPRPVQSSTSWIVNWAKGPKPPRIWKIRPIFPKLQAAPLTLLDRYAPKRRHRLALLAALYFCFLLVFITVLHHSAFSEEVPGYGSPQTLACTDSFWDKNNGCGLDGNDCRPFENSTFAFRCQANCLHTQILNPYAIGDQVVAYKPLVIGGPSDPSTSVESCVYRGDSFICSAAIHAGFITNQDGGCGAISLIGNQTDFPSVSQHGINSFGFNSDFPLSFAFLEDTSTGCKDLRWPLLAVTIVFTTLLALFTTSPAVFFFSEFCALFFHVALVSDPPSQSSYYGLLSSAIGRFLPAAFCAYAIYIFAVRRTLTGLRAQIEKAVLWLGACFVGCLNNYTFDKIPIQRLTGHDLQQQPGAITALVIIVIVLVVIALGQAWALRVEGLFPKYLALYLFMGFCLCMFLAIPNMNLRIHHYILALLLLPGTAMQTRPSLLYQGLLVGLFIDGTARWGFDSLVQTPAQLQGDALIGSALPNITAPLIGASSNITFFWDPIPSDFDGISILVNDVERFRSYVYDGSSNFTWTRTAPSDDPEYFRFGYMSGASSGDYTMAGTWHSNGTWTQYPDGST
ncbi:MAG: hypothetical protein Q9159_000178 [Coniocarpon cinnabarinum]